MLVRETQPTAAYGGGSCFLVLPNHPSWHDQQRFVFSVVPLKRKEAAGNAPLVSSIFLLFFYMASMTSLLASSSVAEGLGMVKDLSLLFLPLTVALH